VKVGRTNTDFDTCEGLVRVLILVKVNRNIEGLDASESGVLLFLIGNQSASFMQLYSHVARKQILESSFFGVRVV